MTKKGTIHYELDIVLLVAVKNEYIALKEWSQKLKKSSDINFYQLPDGQTDADMVFEVEHSDGKILRYHIYKLPHPSMGSDATTYLATKTIYKINPLAICMVGICAGDPGRNKDKDKVIELGDVIIACSTVRHDYGKLELKPLFSSDWVKKYIPLLSKIKMRLHFDHRLHTNTISGMDESFFRLADFISEIDGYNKQLLNTKNTNIKDNPGKAHLGIFSTGNQIIKVPGIFEYFKNNVEPNVGDEDERELLAIEMEAHSMVYAAKQAGNVGWLVVKGVVDFADLDKHDRIHKLALANAFDFLGSVLPSAIVRGFCRSRRDKKLLKYLQNASSYYEEGDFAHAREKIKKAYNGGLRTNSARKLYLKSLMRIGNYDEAIQTLEDQRKRIWYNDPTTIELIAEILWRQGDYLEMKRLLDDTELSTSQLLYLSALALIFEVSYSPDRRNKKTALIKAEKAMQSAVSMNSADPKFFIDINHFFACKLLENEGINSAEDSTYSFERAKLTTLNSINANPRRGLIYIYMLMLLALANLSDEFDQLCNEYKKQRNLVIALDNIDMVYARIYLVYDRTSPTAIHYISGISKFIAVQQTIGRAIKPETRGHLETHDV
ncbi:hypothetical protein BMS3Abin11_00998 [bacterium BMS3Abin11]|nr:hypothetical protein BMS3Abin11_00998 [bacterium BMS3Abin11]